MFYGVDLTSRLMLGTAQYPSPAILQAAIAASGAEVITVSLRREGTEGAAFREILRGCNCRILPNTAGCFSAREAITTVHGTGEVLELRGRILRDGRMANRATAWCPGCQR